MNSATRACLLLLSFAVTSLAFALPENRRELAWSDNFAGTIKLCSVFANNKGVPCGNTATHLQTSAMVTLINSLTGYVDLSSLPCTSPLLTCAPY